MTEIDLGPELASFRKELRDWIAAEAPEGLVDLADWNMHVTGGGQRRTQMWEVTSHPIVRAWEEKLLGKRLVCPHFPAEFGGADFDPLQMTVLNEEFRRAGVPRIHRWQAERLVGPAIIAYGTQEQKEQFLPRIVSGRDVYCQGFSEPDAGSDLASIQTRGVVEGDEIVITGQKVWTSAAAAANMMFLLCRTDPSARKHDGLSYVLIDFTDPGIDARPIKQMSGAAEFYEEFIDGVRAPLFNVIGGLDNGWRVAMATLGHERGGEITVEHMGFSRELWELVDSARERGRTGDPDIRQKLAWAYTHTEILRYAGLQTLSRLAQGLAPGPEASIAKLFKSEYHKRFGEIALDIEGAHALVRPDSGGEGWYPTSTWQDVFLASRAETIYSGSNEIQRNIIGERLLGLPRS